MKFPPIFDICHCDKCNEIVWGGHQYKSGHNKLGSVSPNRLPFYPIPSLCKCGCNEIVWNGNEFIWGHNKHPREHYEKLSKKMMRENNPFYGKHHSEETKMELSIKCGHIPWNKGKTDIYSEETLEKISNSGKGRIPWNKGKHLSEDHIKHVIENHADLSMEKHYNWKGGISYLPYCYKFNDKLKEKIRNRDGRICQECGKTEEENGEKLSVHHIHYDKENCCPDLISLCHNCNIKANYNRNYWEEHFMEKLRKRNLLIGRN